MIVNTNKLIKFVPVLDLWTVFRLQEKLVLVNYSSN